MTVKDVQLAEPESVRAADDVSAPSPAGGVSKPDVAAGRRHSGIPAVPVAAALAAQPSLQTADHAAGALPTEHGAPVSEASAARRGVRAAFASLLVEPDTRGPRIRLGMLWFLLLLAATTSSRQWTAFLVAFVAAVAAYQIVRSWRIACFELPDIGPDDSGRLPVMPPGTGRAEGLIAALAASLAPLASGFSIGLTGAVFLLVAVLIAATWYLWDADIGATLGIGAVLPSIAAVSIVLTVREDLWAGIFLVVAVSFYDAGSFLLGSEAAKKWEGPIGGVFGVLAVTFTVATVGTGDLSRPQWWIGGALVAAMCPVGQWVATWMLPSPQTRARGLRRLDAYLVSGPAFLAACWLMGS